MAAGELTFGLDGKRFAAGVLKLHRSELEPIGMSDVDLDLQQSDLGVRVPVKVVPGASRSRVLGILDGALKVAVAAPPEKGKANKALIKILAETFDLPKNRVSIEQGQSSHHKIVLLHGADADHVRNRLAPS